MTLDHTVGVHDQVTTGCYRSLVAIVGQNANSSRDAELDETVVDGVHPAAKPGRGACTCLVRSARAARPRGCRTVPPAQGSRRLWREPRALCVRDSPHLDRWFRATPRATTSTSQSTSTPTAGVGLGIARSGSRREDGRHRLASLLTPQAMSLRHVQGSIDPSYPQSYLEVQLLIQPLELAQRDPVVTASRPSRLGCSQRPMSLRLRTAGHTSRCRGSWSCGSCCNNLAGAGRKTPGCEGCRKRHISVPLSPIAR